MCYFTRHDIIIVNANGSSNDCCQVDGQTGLSLSLDSLLLQDYIVQTLWEVTHEGPGYSATPNPGDKQLGREHESEHITLGMMKRGMVFIL